MKQVLINVTAGEVYLADVPPPMLKGKGVIVQTAVSFVSSGTERMLVTTGNNGFLDKLAATPQRINRIIDKIKAGGINAAVEAVKKKFQEVPPVIGPVGYSCAGIVTAVGEDVEGLRVGDRVAAAGAGYANHAEFNYVPKNLVARIPDHISFEDASSTTLGAIALQGVRQCQVRVGESVCVIGLGLLGSLAVQILKASGCIVIGFDPNPERCVLAAELGADVVCAKDLVTACDDATRGYGVDAALITASTPSNEPVTVAGQICRQKGTVVVTGLVGMDIPREQFYRKELDFRLSLSYGPGRYDPLYEEKGRDYPYGYVRWTEQRNMEAFLRLIAEGKVTPSRLVTHRFSLDQATKAYQLLSGEIKEKYSGILLNYETPVSVGAAEEVIVEQTTNAPPAGKENHIGLEREIPAGRNGAKERYVAGFIGFGGFTRQVLFPAIKSTGLVAPKAICNASGLGLADIAAKESIKLTTTDPEQLLKDPEIDLVFITTRHDSHGSLVCLALSAGKHVFVEKPLCIHEREIDKIVEAYRTNRHCALLVGFNRRFSPHARMVKEYFSDRKTPMVVNYRVNAGFIDKKSWIQDPEIGGGRIIGEVCHFIDAASYLIGSNPAEVSATAITTINEKLSESDNLTIAIRFADGSLANINYIALGPTELPKERCEVFAAGSYALINDYRTTECYGKLGARKYSGKNGAQEKGHKEEIETFLESIRKGMPNPISLGSTVLTMKCCFAAHQSLANRRSILLNNQL